MMNRFFFFLLVLVAAIPLRAQTTVPKANTPLSAALPTTRPTLYVVGYAHLDTQWRWSYPQVIAEFLHNTMQDNFKLFEKYPHYVFNFTGANRYLMMKEYYPEDFQTLKKYVAAGRWFPAGSSMEEGDVNMPDGEAIIRQVLYGNQFFHREFGVQSDEFMLPDCFGFQASLPSVLAHCGIKEFSTQKLSWGSAVGIPFNVGVWNGPDGKGVVAALNPGSYTSGVDDDLSQDPTWLSRVEEDGQKSGVYVDYHYFGTGDRGGSPNESSVRWVEKSVTGNGPLRVISGPADQMVKDLSPGQIAMLPRYEGDLLLTNHSCGSLSSQAFVKRTNRKLEELGDAAERAAVSADWLGSAPYPFKKLLAAWTLQLGAHFHDTMAGTALPKAYEYSWNNMILALNQFAAVVTDSVGAVAQSMDTRGDGIPVVIYNPLSVDRQDDAEVTIPNAPDAFAVQDPAGKTVSFQILSKGDAGTKIIFAAEAPSVGFSIYHVVPSQAAAAGPSELKVDSRTVENARFKVTLNDAGDIASVFDKQNNREVLSAPARLEFLHQNPKQYPAWNMDYEDRIRAPIGYVDGPCTFRIAENGPARVAIETQRQARGSTVTQLIRLSAGEAGDRVEVVNHVDWQTPEVSLEARFPMSFGNPLATYESQSAAVQRGNNNEKKFEVPQQQWLDLTASDGSFGCAILNDCKYGSDKPDDSTIRLTLLYTPGVQAGYQDQGTQDFGRHEFTYAIVPHANGWQQAKIPWTAQRLNQPLFTFLAKPHDGALGKTISVASVNDSNVSMSAMKKAEDSDEIIVRLRETDGSATQNTTLSFAQPIQSAREVDGQEREIGPAKLVDGKLVTQMTPFLLRAFAVKLAAASAPAVAVVSQPVSLPYDLDAVSRHENLTDGDFDGQGHTFAAETFPAKVQSEGIEFSLGSTDDGKNNALRCHGQNIELPAGFSRVYLLAAAVNGDTSGDFKINGSAGDSVVHQTVADWSGYIGQWDNRVWRGVVPELTYNFANKFAGIVPGFIKRDTVAWFSSHRHDPTKGNEFYKFTYLFKYGFDLPAGATSLTLPDNSNICVFAMTVAKSDHDGVTSGRPLYDTLEDHRYTSPVIQPAAGTFTSLVNCSIDHALYGGPKDIHFTVDGSEPTESSPAYTASLRLATSVTVRARQFEKGQPIGEEVSQKYVINDITPPTVTSVSALAGLPTANVVFSKPVQKDLAENGANYKLDPPIGIASAKLLEDGQTVSLTLAGPFAAANSASTISISGIADTSPAGNQLVAVSLPLQIDGPAAHADDFIADGQKGKEFRAPGEFGKAGAAWTISFFVRSSEMPGDLTLIAGFGTNRDNSDGAGRYLGMFPDGLRFWSRNQDVTGAPFELNRWQMLTASYDGTILRLYKDGQLINQRAIDLSDDSTMVRLAPTDAWQHQRRFKGEIKDFSIWPVALQPAAVMELERHAPN